MQIFGFDGTAEQKHEDKILLAQPYALKAGDCYRALPRLDGKGRMVGGVLVRHLVLPGHRDDSREILKHVASEYGADSVLLSLMSQYTPDFYIESGCPGGFKNLSRRVTSFEYDSVMRLAVELGFDGYFQRISSADRKYTPEFNR